MTWLRNRLEYWAVRCLLWLVRVLPVSCAYGLASVLAAVYYRVGGGRRRIALENLALAFPELSDGERRRIARACYANAAGTLAESMLVLTGKYDREQVLRMVDLDQWERLRKLEDESQAGLLIITAHFGNWEMLSHCLGLCSNRKGNVIGRKTGNPLLEKHVVQPLRERFGSQLIHKKRALMRCIRALRRGEHVGMLIDQKSNRKDGVSVQFFGEELLAPAAPAVLQLRYGVVVVPAFLVRTGPRTYCLEVGDPVPPPDPAATEEEGIRQLTQKHQQEIETMIREYPEQWFWMHDRWRKRH